MVEMTEDEKRTITKLKMTPERMGIDEYKKALGGILARKSLTAGEIIGKIDKGDKDFSNTKIVGLDWAGRDLSGCNFQNSVLQWVSFSNCKLVGADFSNALIEWSIFSNADLTKTDFTSADVWSSAFNSAILDNTSFRNANLRWVVFADANINAADFSNAFKFKMFESWHELSDLPEGDWNLIFDYMKLFGLSDSQAMFFKSQVIKYRSTSEKIKFVYDFGIRSFGQNVYSGSPANEVVSSKDSYTSTDTYTVIDPYASKKTRLKGERQSYQK